jgi:hypothetical protein
MPPGAIVRERARNGRVRDSRGLRATRSDRGGGDENPGDENARNSRTNRHEKTEERPRPRSFSRRGSNARFDRVSKIGTLVLPLESRFFPRLFFFETVHACESASREGKEACSRFPFLAQLARLASIIRTVINTVVFPQPSTNNHA